MNWNSVGDRIAVTDPNGGLSSLHSTVEIQFSVQRLYPPPPVGAGNLSPQTISC